MVEPATEGEASHKLPAPSGKVGETGRFIENISPEPSSHSHANDDQDLPNTEATGAASDPQATEKGSGKAGEVKRQDSKRRGSLVGGLFRKGSSKSAVGPATVTASKRSTDAEAIDPPKVTGVGAATSTEGGSRDPPTLLLAAKRTAPSTPAENGLNSFESTTLLNASDYKSPAAEPLHEPCKETEKQVGIRLSEGDSGEELHPFCARIYPLSHFIGFRPRSHPHWPDDVRLPPDHPRFNRFHYMTGRILSFGLPPLGHAGHADDYRDPETSKLNLSRMYRIQMMHKLVDVAHSVIAVWTLIAMLALMSRGAFFRTHGAPLVIAAFGTEAVITFVAYRAELAQPKNVLFGNSISAVLSVALTKAWNHTDFEPGDIDGDSWIAASTIVAAVVFTMMMLGVTHPPGGALAVLVISTPTIYDLDWYLVPVVIFSTLVVLGWALIINNLGNRRYPGNFFYANAFRQPPMLGPEGFKYHDAPYAPRKRHKRSPDDPERGFYRVPQTGSRLTRSPTRERLEPQRKPARQSRQAERRKVEVSSPIPSDTGRMTPSGWPEGELPVSADTGTRRPSQPAELPPSTTIAATPANTPGAAAATTRSQAETTPIPTTTAQPEPTEPPSSSISTAPMIQVSAPPPPPPAIVASRLIEEDVLVRGSSKDVSRSGSKKRTVQVHYNDPRGGTKTAQQAGMPAVQWR